MMSEKRPGTGIPVVTAISISVAAALGVAGIDASASVINVGSNLAANTYVSTALPASGSFDISALLAGFDVAGGSVAATFVDNTDSFQYAGVSYSPYSYTGSNQYVGYYESYNCGTIFYVECTRPVYYTDYYYSRTGSEYYPDPPETADLAVGASTVSSSSHYASLWSSYAGTVQSNSWHGSGHNYYNTNYYNYYNGYRGLFTAVINLDATALNDLNADGLLGFSIGAHSDFIVQNVTLTADLVPESSGGTGVPEPGSGALVMLALGALGLAPLRRKSGSRPTH